MNNLEQLSNYLKLKFSGGEVEGYELVVALMAMVKDKKIDKSDIRPILFKVFEGNIEGIARSLDRASKVVDEKLLNEIVNEVREVLP